MLLTVSAKAWLLPTRTLPKARLVGLDPSAPSATPVPDNGMDSVGSGASDVIVTLPLAGAVD